jgi:putative ABC transport system permease protein
MTRLFHELAESIRIAFAQIRANKMRSLLTALGVVIGIVSVTLMSTAILGIGAFVDASFAMFGDDVLYVTKYPWRQVDDWWTYRSRPPIKTDYARQINDWIETRPDSPLRIAVPTADTPHPQSMSTVIRGDYQLNYIYTMGTTDEYTRISKSDMKTGRFFNAIESHNGANVIVIGFDVADALFPNEDPIGQTVRIRSQTYTILGVVARQGSFLGLFSFDSMIAMPLNAFKRNFWVGDNVDICVLVDQTRMDAARDELRGLMRRIRQLPPERKDDFEINETNIAREPLANIQIQIGLAAIFITGLALFVGAIGIMNITFVSVKERTKEIGTRKAIGARRRTILLQFLIEAAGIGVVGGIIGLALTLGIRALLARAIPDFPLPVPLWLIAGALAVSLATGVLSGFLPALRASKLDPVEALRYE